MFLSVVILGRFTTETHAMALYISTDTPPLFTPRPGTFPRQLRIDECLINRLGGLLDPISGIGIA
ncbi:hypothetical protein MAV101_07475 [Mycobacterium avium subsp. hominissuis 101]|nr:hypothetical protein MAV101_07475 [Mycobacterium avium subsp. hominissuis 101]